jgi:hypothetical protein
MDRPNLHESLFSRGTSTPPPTVKQHYGLQASSSPNHIDNHFHNRSGQPPSQQIGSPGSGSLYTNPALGTPIMPMDKDTISSSSSAVTVDRQSALLSLLGSVPAGNVRGASGGGPAPQPHQQAQQVPTPPGSSQRTGNSPSHANETQGKHLLEQLMSG